VPAATAELAPARVGRQGGQERTKFVSTTKNTTLASSPPAASAAAGTP
jgi:hypothetical protein